MDKKNYQQDQVGIARSLWNTIIMLYINLKILPIRLVILSVMANILFSLDSFSWTNREKCKKKCVFFKCWMMFLEIYIFFGFRQCFGSGSPWNHFILASKIRVAKTDKIMGNYTYLRHINNKLKITIKNFKKTENWDLQIESRSKYIDPNTAFWNGSQLFSRKSCEQKNDSKFFFSSFFTVLGLQHSPWS